MGNASKAGLTCEGFVVALLQDKLEEVDKLSAKVEELRNEVKDLDRVVSILRSFVKLDKGSNYYRISYNFDANTIYSKTLEPGDEGDTNFNFLVRELGLKLDEKEEE